MNKSDNCPPPDFHFVSPCLPALAKLLDHPDKQVVGNACFALAHMSKGQQGQVQAIIDLGICPRLADFVHHESYSTVVRGALRTLGNIIKDETQAPLKCIIGNILPSLLHHSSSKNEDVLEEVCLLISKITAGTTDQVQLVIDNNLFPPIIGILKDSKIGMSLREPALLSVTNVLSKGSPAQVEYLVKQGCIPALCECLQSDISTDIISVALDGLKDILETGNRLVRDCKTFNPYLKEFNECGGVNQLEALQNEELYERTMSLILNYLKL
jgi:importin subunit alpha-2